MINSTLGIIPNQINQSIKIQSKRENSQCIPYFFSTTIQKNTINKPKENNKKNEKK